ncbi:hypothetical protein GCM10009864_30270 [Streptomyces lunalinharesii]|uniref:Uncharacterized protein n=1 Tax=Streptomyces lunalinharesii TaxID=333384 RepID=A0ABN3RU60_9ACTN
MDSPRQTTSTSGAVPAAGTGGSLTFEDLVTIGCAPSLCHLRPARRARGPSKGPREVRRAVDGAAFRAV